MMSKITRYGLYVIISVGLGYVSTLGETDYISTLCSSIIPWLIALFAVNTTITVQSISHLVRFHSFFDVDISSVVGAMRRTCFKQVVILSAVYVTLLAIQYIRTVCDTRTSFLTIFQNSIVTFSLIYYVVSIYDNSMALYDLIITEAELKKQQNKEGDQTNTNKEGK